MKIESVNVGMPRPAKYEGKDVSTGIFKSTVPGLVKVGKCNLEGDGQADLTVHGGVDKAVYAYSLDHYDYWQKLLGKDSFPYGQFGENLTVSGLDETALCIGDHLLIGTALFAITQPRVPCFKLGVRFDNPEVPKLFTKSARTGCYLKVLREGVLQAGDTISIVQRGAGQVSVKQLFQAYLRPADADAVHALKQVLQAADLSAEWRVKIQSRLA